MIEHTLNDFIRQVHRDNRQMQFPVLNDQRFKTTFIRPYTIDNNETDRLAPDMEEQLSFTSFIEEFCQVLKEEDIPRNKELAEYISNLYKIFSGYSTEGHYSGRYFSKVLSFLNGFQSFIRLSNQRDEELLIHLQSLSAVKPGKDDFINFTAEKASFYLNCKGRYDNELLGYFNVFQDFLHEESDKSKGLKVTTRTEQCMLTLTDMILHSIEHTESAMKLLDKFNKKMLLAEKQVQYN